MRKDGQRVPLRVGKCVWPVCVCAARDSKALGRPWGRRGTGTLAGEAEMRLPAQRMQLAAQGPTLSPRQANSSGGFIQSRSPGRQSSPGGCRTKDCFVRVRVWLPPPEKDHVMRRQVPGQQPAGGRGRWAGCSARRRAGGFSYHVRASLSLSRTWTRHESRPAGQPGPSAPCAPT